MPRPAAWLRLLLLRLPQQRDPQQRRGVARLLVLVAPCGCSLLCCEGSDDLVLAGHLPLQLLYCGLILVVKLIEVLHQTVNLRVELVRWVCTSGVHTCFVHSIMCRGIGRLSAGHMHAEFIMHSTAAPAHLPDDACLHFGLPSGFIGLYVLNLYIFLQSTELISASANNNHRANNNH